MFELAAGTKILVDGFYPVGTTGGPVAGSQFHSFKASPGNIANLPTDRPLFIPVSRSHSYINKAIQPSEVLIGSMNSAVPGSVRLI
jgi:hypothetical protein